MASSSNHALLPNHGLIVTNMIECSSGVLIAHLRPRIPTTIVSSIKKGIGGGILAERYRTSRLSCLRFAIKNIFNAASRSSVASTLLITMPGKSLMTSFESGSDFYVSRKDVRSILPSSVKRTSNEILSLKYHTGC